MNEELFLNALLILIVVLAVYSIRAMIGIYAIYREEGGRQSLLWRALIVVDVLAVASSVALIFPAIISLFDLPPLPLTGAGVALAVIGLQLGVVIQWHVFKRIRRERGAVADHEGHETLPSPEMEESE